VTDTELSKYKAELAKPVYADYLATGNVAAVATLWNTPATAAGEFIAADVLTNALETRLLIPKLERTVTAAVQPVADIAETLLFAVKYGVPKQFNVNNTEIQVGIPALESAGVITADDVTAIMALAVTEYTPLFGAAVSDDDIRTAMKAVANG
jgi:hypothetical protein